MGGWHTRLASYFATWCCMARIAHSIGFLTQGCQLNWEYEDGEARTYCLDHVCNINAYTSIPLDWCIADVDGVLTPQKMGNFRQRCFDCKITEDRYYLGCDCIKFDGTIVYSQINMNDVLYNWWGWLSCSGYYEKLYERDYPCKHQIGWMPDSSVPDMTCAHGCPEVKPPNWIKLEIPAVANASSGNTSDALAQFPSLAGQSGPRPAFLEAGVAGENFL
ncbi:hypothetical protein F4781DRAFT_25760 [Annulohypoxylon bovei var. microspora]|nr:hypothetical protein F4781DRAFT_25760 [Annulohypoxylon bovei var. microspora]